MALLQGGTLGSPDPRTLLPVEGPDPVCHVILLILSQFRINRKGEDLLRGLFRGREIPAAVVETGIALLEMERERIVDLGPHALLLQKLPEAIPLRGADYILIVDVAIFVFRHGKLKPRDQSTRA